MIDDNKQDLSGRYKLSFEKKNKDLLINLTGEFKLKNLKLFSNEIKKTILDTIPDSITIDFTGISYMDSAAALAIIQIQRDAAKKKINCLLINLTDDAKGIFSVIHGQALDQEPFKEKEFKDNFFVQAGQASLKIANDFFNFVSFIGELLSAICYTIFHPKSMRGKDILFYMQRAGVDGLPIVGLISMLIGLIIAFMSFLQFRQIGANIYVPSLVSFAMVKELGPIMTAILVAGRSGSAFAAEIGTMVVNEEVDALNTMGFDPIRFLAVPKVLAMIVVVPILTIYSDFFGVMGGLIVGVTGLDLTVHTYLTQSLKTVKVFDIVTSLIKAAVFAGLIAGIGCQRGFQVRSGAQDGGKYTTSAVVSAIFLIVVADSIFAVTFYYMK